MKKFRIFYAPQVFRTWEKIFILTDDGTLYCEYLMRFRIQTIIKTGVDYNNFRPTDYSWGKGVRGDNGIASENYQSAKKELTWEEYQDLRPSNLLHSYNAFSSQIRWVENYLTKNNLTYENWDNTYINNNN